MAEEDFDDSAPGWDAIDAALRPLYGDREPFHMGTVVPYALGGPDPIHGISAYKNAEPRPHWHFVTYGFSELWAKESSDPEVSGFGFELTFRLACKLREKKPPTWAFNFLQNVGGYVFETGNALGVGHTLPLHGPMEVGANTRIHATSFCLDPLLPPMKTCHGRVEFLQVIGITMDELDAISSWNAAAFLKLRRRTDPLLITDLERTSWMQERAFATKVARRTEKEGSSCGWLALVLNCDTQKEPVRVRLQTIAVPGLKRRLLGRLPFGRELVLNGKRDTVTFRPGARSRLKIVEEAVSITLREDHLREFADSLQPHVGRYAVPGVKNVVVQVARTKIKDKDGNVVDVVE